MPYTSSSSLSVAIGSLAANTLLLETLSGEEAISRLFVLELGMVAESPVDFSSVIGQSATVQISLPQDPNSYVRYFKGIISRFEEGDRVIGLDGVTTLIRYRAEMVPNLWKLTQTVRSQIFSAMSAIDIVNNLLQAAGLTATADSSSITRPQCAQYCESDFNLYTRLLESEGFSYFLVQSASADTLYIAADATKYQAVDDPATIDDQILIDDSRPFGALWSWGKSQEINPVAYKSRETDYLLSAPKVDSSASAMASITAGTASHSNNDLGSGISEFDEGALAHFALGSSTSAAQAVATAQANSQSSKMVTIDGVSGCLNFSAGRTFTLGDLVGSGSGRMTDATNRAGDYLLTRVVHQASAAGAFTDPGGPDFSYQNEFHCVPKGVTYRAPLVGRRPTIEGVQTAAVVDPTGASAEIATDTNGRVSVLPYWADSGNLMWARVGTMWAGNSFGSVRIPRVGEEVIVAFINGDPDQPLVVGCVFNANNMQPYGLTDNQTRTVLKTRSTPSGSSDNFNELRFEDKMGSEEVFFHAEKDFNREVENNDSLTVGSSKADDGSQTITIYNNRTATITQGNDALTISTGNETITISKGNRTVEIDAGNDTLTIKAGGRTTKMAQDDALTIDTGNQTIKVSAGQSSTDAATGIKLTSGSSSLEITPSGITIKSAQVQVSADAAMTLKALSMTVEGSGMASIKGDGMLQLKGGITTIN
jgi:type VI secretion system secreted protein VgrG